MKIYCQHNSFKCYVSTWHHSHLVVVPASGTLHGLYLAWCFPLLVYKKITLTSFQLDTHTFLFIFVSNNLHYGCHKSYVNCDVMICNLFPAEWENLIKIPVAKKRIVKLDLGRVRTYLFSARLLLDGEVMNNTLSAWRQADLAAWCFSSQHCYYVL